MSLNGNPTIQHSDMRRLRGFRLPCSYVMDQMLGYHGNSPFLKMYRIAPPLAPQGTKLTGCWYEHQRNDFYFQIEHESFPEHKSTEFLAPTEVMLNEVEVVTREEYDRLRNKLLKIREILSKPVTVSVDGVSEVVNKIWNEAEL